jgi:hypothetical protein
LITENAARYGGGLYNDASGVILELFGTIHKNSASKAGGGIFNAVSGTSGGIIKPEIGPIVGLHVTFNTAPTGGGIFNRAVIELSESSVTDNKALTTGSGEMCSGTSCDGSGGGVLSVHVSNSAVATRFNLMAGSDFSRNQASVRGGAVSSAGFLELSNLTINDNTAPAGAAIYVVSPTDGSGEYCNVTGADAANLGPTQINNNKNGGVSNPGFSIVDGGVVNSAYRCTMTGALTPEMTATGNDAPVCNRSVIRAGHDCPQP